MLIFAGGEIIESVPIGTDVESKLLELTEEFYDSDSLNGYNKNTFFLNYESIKDPYIRSYSVDKKEEKYYDYYNNVIYNEYGEVDDSLEIVRSDGVNGHYNDEKDLIFLENEGDIYNFILNPDYDYYSCDHCGGKFLDYQESMKIRIEYSTKKIDAYARIYDLCRACRKTKSKENQKEGGKKAIETMYKRGKIPSSRQQRYICNLLNGELNKRIGKYFVDIVFNNNIILEYDGSGHWLGSRYSDKTIDQINQEDIERDNILISKGYKVIRFISKEDLLPSDKTIKKIIDDLVLELNTGKSKVIYEVVKENFKDNELRKIEKRDV